MAIDATKGLPSFSEMYNAYKNRGNLGDVLKAGVTSYYQGKDEANKAKYIQSEAAKNQAEAAYNQAHAKMLAGSQGIIRLDQITDPTEKATLAQYAQPNAEGIMVVPVSTYNAVTHKNQNQEALDLKTQLAKTQQEHQNALLSLNTQHQSEINARDLALQKAQEEKQALANQLQPRAQTINAASKLAESANTVEKPTLLNEGASFVKEKMGFGPTDAVAAERQGQAARSQLQSMLQQPNASANPVDQATGIAPTPAPPLNQSPRYQAIQELQNQKQPVTEANIKFVMDKMGQ